jgi:hypothetical protein
MGNHRKASEQIGRRPYAIMSTMRGTGERSRWLNTTSGSGGTGGTRLASARISRILGGRDNFAADRELAEVNLRLLPQTLTPEYKTELLPPPGAE